MSIKWLIGIATLFMIGQVVSNIIEYSAPIGDPETQGTAAYWLWSAITSFQLVGEGSFLSDIVDVIVGVGKLIPALFFMIIWDYAYLEGNMQIVRWCLLFPISLGLIYGVIQTIRGSSTG